MGQQQAAGTGTAAAPGARGVAEIQKDMQAVGMELSQMLSAGQLMDPAKRAEVAPKAIPALKKMAGLMEELGNAEPQAKEAMAASRYQVLGMGAILGDKEAEGTLNKLAEGSDPKAALSAKAALLSADWVKTSKDPAAQAKVLDRAEALAKANPSDQGVVSLIASYTMFGAASPELKDRAGKIMENDLKGPVAEQMKQQMAGARKLHAMENKPLVLSGASLDGKTFSTEAWKGKVILVDFWATWCGPCRAELPRVKKAYQDYHAKGLEVLGVSCDNSADELKKFLAEDKGMPWPQLFDAANPGWHPLAKQFGIDGIPTMFLIDKKGVLRTVEAREDFETQIPKLLAE
jgi:thiol-disulfide isomerase/thioredoxin